jgi:YVTN family beta-propeller protein
MNLKTQPSNHVAVVDRETLTATDYILVGRRVWYMALTPEEDKLYTTNGVSGDVTMVDVAGRKAVKTIKVGRYPWGIAILPKQKIPQ